MASAQEEFFENEEGHITPAHSEMTGRTLNLSNSATLLTILGALILLGVIGYLLLAAGSGFGGSGYGYGGYHRNDYYGGNDQYQQYDQQQYR